MFEYIQRFFKKIIYLIIVFIVAFVNWNWPLQIWLGDAPWVGFVWLGIFFVLLDIVIEIFIGLVSELRLAGEAMSFGRHLRKISGEFKVKSGVKLSNNFEADYVVVGSSGVWVVNVRDKGGAIGFNGEDLVQDGSVLSGVTTMSLEKSYALASILKEKLNKDFKVVSVIVFSSSQAKFQDVPDMARGVYITTEEKAVNLIETTDVQLLDTKTIGEIYKNL